MGTDMSERGSLEEWVKGELLGRLGLSDAEAEGVASACCVFKGRPSPGGAATVVAIARAVVSLPAAREWWERHGSEARQSLLRGFGDVEGDLAEALAPPAPDVLDMNWPSSKVFWAVDVPDELSVGDELLVGDGMGQRRWVRVVEHEGHVGVVVEWAVPNLLDELWEAASHEADDAMGR